MEQESKNSLLSLRHLTIEIERGRDGSKKGVEETLICDLSLEVARGKITALLGESGAGKSLLASAILRILPTPPFHVSGQIWFKGEDLLALPEKKMQAVRGQKISMIFQEPKSALNPVFTIGDQLLEASRTNSKEEVFSALQEVQLEPKKVFASYPHELSGGMLQRVLIAMSLIGEPELIIADEPTTALDVTIQAEILDLLARLKEKKGISILLITHDLGVVAEVAESVFILYDGRIVEEGSTSALFDHPAHPYTSELFNARYFNPGQAPFKIQERAKGKQGCGYLSRCPFAMKCCEEGLPPFYSLNHGQQKARCMLYDPHLEDKISYEEDDLRG